MSEGRPSGGEGSGDLVGTVLASRYRILARLGEGAMGAVYLGEHLRMGRKDAIKVISRSMASNAEAMARFEREARNASFISHPNVCAVYDFGETPDGLAFLAMEFVEGETLNAVLEGSGGRLPSKRATHIARQVTSALEAAHAREIVHRDLKPDNIMLTRARDGSDVVKVVDFGIAKGIGDEESQAVTRMGFVIGTPEYMSPEQLAGDRLDGRSDLYSLGLVLFRLLTGHLPFRAASSQELMLKRLTEDPLPLSAFLPEGSYPSSLQGVLDRALQRSAEDRFPSAVEMGRALDRVLSGVVQPPAPPPEAGRTVPETVLAGQGEPTFQGGSGPGGAPPPVGPWQAPTPPGGERPPGGKEWRMSPLLLGGGATGVVLVVAALVWGLRGSGGEVVPLPPPDTAVVVDQTDPPDPDLPRQEEEREPPPEIPRPPEQRPATPPAIVVTPAEARALLLRQLSGLSGSPSRAVLAALRDSAQAVWGLDGASSSDRSLAAYITATTLLPLGGGDSIQGIGWLERSLDLDPQNRGALTLLQSHRPGRR